VQIRAQRPDELPGVRDVILLEGIYLLKREHRRHYGVSLWID